MAEVIIIQKEEYDFLKKNSSTKEKLDQLTILSEKTFTKDWDSKEDEVWDEY